MKKFTLSLISLFLTVGAVAQITDVTQLSNNKCYHITSKDANRGAFYAKPGEGYLSHCGSTYGNYLNRDVAVNPESEAQQFAFVSYKENLYLYSVSEKKFAQKDGNFVKLVNSTTDFVTVTPNGGYFNVKINGTNKLNFSGGYTYGVYANYESDDNGNNLVITEAGDFDPTDAIDALSNILENDITFNWTATTSWNDVAVENYQSEVFNANALGYGIKYIEGQIEITGARTASVTFQYTSGNCALNVRGIEVVDENGNIVACDYHVGKTGTNSTGNVYTVKVAEAGVYKVRCYATFGSNDRANDTNGTITISFAKEDVANFFHNLTFSAEYATLHLGYKVAVPAGVEAYIVSSVSDGLAIMEQVTDVIPAATPVILKNTAATTEYKFAYTANDAATVGANLLKGSIANRYVAEEAYVLGKVNGVVGLYLAEMTDGAWLNNANKAYLPAPAGSNAASYSFRFGEGTTGVENVVVENEVKTIFDITGRRVEEITAPGIYIVNGHKVLVK